MLYLVVMARRANKHLHLPTVVRSMHAGLLPPGHVRDMLLHERTSIVAMMNNAAVDLHIQDPLDIPPDHDSVILKQHISQGCGWKFAYAQRFGETVLDTVENGRKQCLSRMRGAIAHCAEKVDKPSQKATLQLQRYRYVPESMQDSIDGTDLAIVAALAVDGGWIAACCAVSRDEIPAGLTEVQAGIVAACRDFAVSRHRAPMFNRLGPKGTDTYVVQLRPDERTYIGFMNKGAELYARVNDDLRAAFSDVDTKSFDTTIVLTDLHGKGSFTVPVHIARAVWDNARRGREAEVSGLLLEIGPESVEVRVTIRRPRTTPDPKAFGRMKRRKLEEGDFTALAEIVNGRSHILSRDIGLSNTTAHSLLLRDAPVTAEALRLATFATKNSAKDYLQTHVHPGDNVVKSWIHSGRRFLDHVSDIAGLIDKLRSRIDRGYEKLAAIREALVVPLGLQGPEARIERDMVHPDPFVQRLIKRFFHLFERIRQTKALRIEQYRRIAAIKRCWFGWVTNREAECAHDHNAVVVRENAGYVTIPRDNLKYRGRTFNRLLNNGCRGQVERMASSKLAWLGIPEVVIPSFWTSSTDTRSGVVDSGQRKGSTFTSAGDGRKWDADEHAAETIGVWLLLKSAMQGM